MSTEKEKRRELVSRATKRLLDVPDDAPTDDLENALESVGIDASGTVDRVMQFVREYPKRLLSEAKKQQETEQQAFERFQRRFADISTSEIEAQIQSIIEQLPPEKAFQMRSHHRELSKVTGDDRKTEMLDLLWQLNKTNFSGV